jgi:predicted histidine transporter YuiF (NhaC family)
VSLLRPAAPGAAERSRLVAVAIVALVVGLGLMLPFEATLTRLGGMAALATFVICGVLAVANPEFLAGDGADEGQG